MKNPLDSLSRFDPALAVAIKIANSILTITFFWLVARLLDIEDAGIFLFGYSLLLAFVQVSRLGTEYYLVKELSKDHGFGQSYIELNYCMIISSIVSMTLMLGAVVLAASGFFPVFSESQHIESVYWLVPAAGLYSLCQASSCLFQSEHKIFLQFWSLSLGFLFAVCTISIGTALLGIDLDAAGYSKIVLLSLIATFGSVVYPFRKITKSRNISSNRPRYKFKPLLSRIVKQVRPYFFITLVQIGINWTSIFLIGILLIAKDVAIYSVVDKIAFFVSFAFSAINNIMMPRISRAYSSNNPGSFTSEFIKFSALSNASGIFTFSMLVLFGMQFLSLFGDEYIAGYITLVILSARHLIAVFTGPVGTVLIMTGSENAVRKNLLLSLIFLVLFCLSLIPVLGIIGAALSSAATALVYNVLNVALFRKVHNINIFSGQTIRRQWRYLISLNSPEVKT